MATVSAAERAEGAITVVAPRRRAVPVGRLVLYLVLLISGVVAALPFFWMIFGSFKTGAEIRQIPPTFVPETWTLDNYKTILQDPDLPLTTFYRNSLFVAVMNVITTLFMASLLGYIFAKYRFRGRQVMFWYLMALMMVPPSVLMIPNYLILSQLGLLNNLWGLVVTVIVDPFAVFVMRQFIMSLPDEQIESARIDGASRVPHLPIRRPAPGQAGAGHARTADVHVQLERLPVAAHRPHRERQAHHPRDPVPGTPRSTRPSSTWSWRRRC